MSVLVWLIVPVLVVIAFVSVKVYRDRKPTSLEAGMRDFRRGLNALDPANDPLKREPSGSRRTETPPKREG